MITLSFVEHRLKNSVDEASLKKQYIIRLDINNLHIHKRNILRLLTEHTNMHVVFESRVLKTEDEMSTEFVFCAGVEIEDIFLRAFDPINLH